MAKWWSLLLILLLLALAGMAWIAPRGMPVEARQPERKAIREYIEEEGKTRLPDVVRITMPLQGRILPIELNEGDRVTSGQVVARLDPRDLDTELLERANTVRRYDKNLQQIDLAIEQAAQTVKASKAKYDFALRLFNRTKSLSTTRSTTQTELERDELQVTQSSLDLRKEELNKSIYEILRGVFELLRDSDAARRDQAERDRQRAEITCPIDGMVLNTPEHNERVMLAGELLMEVGDLQQLQVEADILTQDVTAIRVGAPVDIAGLVADAEPVRGTVTRIYPQGFTKISSLGVEQQRVKVIIDFEPGVRESLAQRGLRPGVDFRVRVEIETARKDGALTIPRAAVFRSAEGTWQAFRIQDGRATLTELQVGLRNDFDVEVLGGLQETDLVIVAPDSTLTEGTDVAAATLERGRPGRTNTKPN